MRPFEGRSPARMLSNGSSCHALRIFPPAAAVSGGVKYWAYADTRGRFAGGFNKDTHPGGDMYVTGMKDLAFRKTPASWLSLPTGEYLKPPPGACIDANFRLQGAVK